jgi:hypothetical protein
VVAVSPVGMGTTLEEELQRPEAFFRGQLSFVSPSRVFAAFADEELVATAGVRWPAMVTSAKHVKILYGVQTAPNRKC